MAASRCDSHPLAAARLDEPAWSRLLQLAAVSGAANFDGGECNVDRCIRPDHHVAGRRCLFSSPVVRRQWIGAGVSLLGVLWVIAHGEPENLLKLRVATGDLIMLAAGLAWSIYTWLLRTQRPPLPLTAFLTVQIALGALMILPFYLLEWIITRQVPAPTPTNFAALVYVVLLPSLAAYYCWDRGVARVGALLPMYFVNLTPVFAACLSWALLDDPIGIYHLVGGALILAGIYLAAEKQTSQQ